ncbi:MAG TPA: cyclic nucleotide-binding domain-containing protein [Kofleriaceae bacterium]
MNPRKAVKELEKQLRKDPHNLVLRVRLAGALVQTGNFAEAIEMYRSVAMAYYAQNRIDQAIAVCHSVLEIAPDHHPSRMLLTELDQRKAATTVAPPTEESDRVEVTPSSARGRRARRPSGFDTSGFTPASEPDMHKNPRFRFDSGKHEPIPRTPVAADETVQGKRFPLPTGGRSTVQGMPPLPAGGAVDRRKRGSERPPEPRPLPQPPRSARPSEATAAERTPSTPDPDEEAPTRIADRWISPARSKPPSSVPPRPPSSVPPRPPRPTRPPRGVSSAPPPAATPEPATDPFEPSHPPGARGNTRPQRPSALVRPIGTPPRDALDESITAPRSLVPPPPGPGPGSTPLPILRRRSPSGPDGGGFGSEADATIMDDGIELARALGRPFGGGADGNNMVEDSHRTLALLAGLPEAAVQDIARGMARHKVRSGEMIVREGEAGDSCYVMAHGEARVLKRDPLQPRGDLMEVSRLGQGDLFGEVAMLSDRRRHASVQAVSDCELIELPRAHLRDVGQRFVEVNQFLERFYRERIIATLVSTAPFFRPLEPAARMALLAHFQFTRVESGARVIQEGERAGGFYLIVLGTVEITKRVSEKRQVLLATLDEGNYFGEMSLLRGDVARASVTATGPTELAVLPAKNFYALVANHPILWDQVRQEAHRRELEMVQIVTGMTGAV